MSDWLFHVIVPFQAALAAALFALAWRTHNVVVRILAFDVLAFMLILALVSVSLHTGNAGYLDIAIVLAMLGFVQTLAMARLVEMEFLRQ